LNYLKKQIENIEKNRDVNQIKDMKMNFFVWEIN